MKALAYAQFRAQHCSGCGTRREEWPPVGDDGVASYPYLADLDECPGCAAVELLQSRISQDKDRSDTHGLKVVLRPNPAHLSVTRG